MAPFDSKYLTYNLMAITRFAHSHTTYEIYAKIKKLPKVLTLKTKVNVKE